VSPGRRGLSVRARLTLWYAGALLAILAVASAASYALFRRSVMHDVDASLLLVAHVVRDNGTSATGVTLIPDPEAVAEGVFGPDLLDKFFQLLDPQGTPSFRSRHLGSRSLPLSLAAQLNAARGHQTFETVELSGHERIRLLTLPVVRGGRLVQLVQVGISLDRAERTLGRYVETLLALIPLGLALATLGGMTIARAGLKPVADISRAARQIGAADLGERVAVRGSGDELDHLAETLNAMLARLEGAFAQMRRFAADAAHELRTPLTALRGGIEVALRADRSSAEYRAVLRSSLEEVERLIRLAEDLLLLSRLEAGGARPAARVALEPLVLEVFDLARRLAQPAGVVVHVEATEPLEVEGDEAALRRAYRNLVENAVKYTPAGGKVELALAREGSTACLSVQDSGCGIAPADVERIFQPFVRLDAARARETGGAGLGLAIARAIVQAHGGTIDVTSVPGSGSRFTIRLPVA
jgi:two-component system OmpR family sensor kinase